MFYFATSYNQSFEDWHVIDDMFVGVSALEYAF
jgi:hypothetical protein